MIHGRKGRMGASDNSSDEEIIISTKKRLTHIHSDESDNEAREKPTVGSKDDFDEGQKSPSVASSDKEGLGTQVTSQAKKRLKRLVYIHSDESDLEATEKPSVGNKDELFEGQKRYPVESRDGEGAGEKVTAQAKIHPEATALQNSGKEAPEEKSPVESSDSESGGEEVIFQTKRHINTATRNSNKEGSHENGNSDKENTVSSTYSHKALFGNKDLYDAESSDEDFSKPEAESGNVLKEDNSYDAEGSCEEDNVVISRTKVKKSPKERKSFSKNKEPKELDQIRSESQRLVRRAQVSLPYHKPRQRSLAEFLQRRPSIPAKSLRMSVDELEVLGKQLEKRVKEAEEFYKSSSEEDAVEKENAEASVVTAGADSKDSKMDLGNEEKKEEEEEICAPENKPKMFRNSCELTEIDSQDLVLKLDTETCDLLQNEKEGKRNGEKTLVAAVGDGLDDCAMSGVEEDGAKHTSPPALRLSEDTQDLHLHLSETETCDLVGLPLQARTTEQSSNLGEAKLGVVEEQKSNLDVSASDESGVAEAQSTHNLSAGQDDRSAGTGASGQGVPADGAGVEEMQLVLEGEDAVLSAKEAVGAPEAAPVSSLLLGADDAATLPTEMPAAVRDSDTAKSASHLDGEGHKSVPPEMADDSSASQEAFDRALLEDSDAGQRSSGDNVFIPQSLLLKEGDCKSPSLADKLTPTLTATPKLKGSPSELVDLDDAPNPVGVKALMHRFMRHSLSGKKPPQKSTVELSVVSAESNPDSSVPEVRREVITVALDDDAPTPRAKLQALQQELQQQIVRQREQEWARRQQEQQEAEAEKEPDEKSECGLLDDEEEEMEDKDTTDTESEEEEEAEDLEAWARREEKKKKQRGAGAFVDDEAEESGDDGGDEGCAEDEDESNDEGDEGDDDNKSEVENDKQDSKEKKRNDAESNHIETVTSSSDTNGLLELPRTSKLKRIKTLDPFDSDDGASDLETSFGSTIPPYQPRGAATQLTNVTANEDDEEHFLPKIVAPSLPTPIAKRTYSEENGTPKSQTEFSETPLNAAICAGLGLDCSESGTDFEAELLGLCSGKFTSQPLPLSQEDELDASAPSQQAKQSDADRTLVPPDTQTTHPLSTEGSGELPVRRKLVILSSDEEDGDFGSKPKSTSKRKLDFSDDESMSGLSFKSDEDAEDAVIDYDSEENEITVNPAELRKKAAAFFEDEAELSESEWGSADEDEKGLDALEWEEGDDEKLDQAAVKEQLGKIHMRQVLDEDQREVRRLQELLLEDGEFHSEGGGRQRQFRWKNLNNLDDFAVSSTTLDDEAAGDEEDQDEEEWRRKRFERETFMQEHQEKMKQEEDLLAENLKAKFKPLPASQPKVQVKRGSFLARSEAALARIAQLTRGGGDGPVLAPTNSRNFVFATLSNDPKEAERQAVKRKRTVAAVQVPVVKKACLNTGLLDQIGY